MLINICIGDSSYWLISSSFFYYLISFIHYLFFFNKKYLLFFFFFQFDWFIHFYTFMTRFLKILIYRLNEIDLNKLNGVFLTSIFLNYFFSKNMNVKLFITVCYDDPYKEYPNF